MNISTFGKRLHAVTGDLGALAFWSVHWILVGDGDWASFMWAGASLGVGFGFSLAGPWPWDLTVLWVASLWPGWGRALKACAPCSTGVLVLWLRRLLW